MNEKIGLRILAALILVAAIAGIGFFAFRAGVAQGSPITVEAPAGEPSIPPVPYPYYGHGMPFHHRYGFGFGFGCFGPLLILFLLLLAVKSFRVLFWGPRWGWGHHPHGPWGRHWENGAPSMFEEWHKRAHNAPTGGGETTEDKKE
jgi:hypothetical protein